MDNTKIVAMAKKWLKYFQGSEFSPIAEKPEFSTDLKNVGFFPSWDKLAEMGQTFGNAMADDAKANAGRITDIQTMGDTIFAKYRSYRFSYQLNIDKDWFVAALERLIELCEENNNGQDRGKP